MSFVRRVIDTTDSLASQGVRARGLLFFPLAPWMIVAAHKSLSTIALAAFLSLGALTFVSWRLWVVFKKDAAKSDALYDEVGKYALASEYHQTESATAAAKRKRSNPGEAAARRD